MRPVLFALAALFAVSLAHADGSVTGKYRLRLPDDAARVARLSGQSSENLLTLRPNGRFLLETGGTVRHGDYRVEDTRLTLRVENGETLRGDLVDGRVTLDGLEFEHVASGVDSLQTVRRFPTDGSTGRRDRTERRDLDETPVVRHEATKPLPAVIPAVPDLTTVFKEPTVRTPAVAAPVLKALDAKEIAGAWTVWRNGREEKGQRMTLKADGTFRFAMVNASSEGTWTVEGRAIVLVWTKVDGEAVEEPGSMRKEIPIGDDGASFKIDTYQYGRATP